MWLQSVTEGGKVVADKFAAHKQLHKSDGDSCKCDAFGDSLTKKQSGEDKPPSSRTETLKRADKTGADEIDPSRNAD